MTWEVRLRDEADRDIREAAEWYENQRQGLGHSFLDEILATLDVLAQQALAYPILHEKTRRVIVKKFPFGIYDTVRGQTAIIVAAVHMSRNPKVWKERM
jgi:plasmid stabilization system protein ParE